MVIFMFERMKRKTFAAVRDVGGILRGRRMFFLVDRARPIRQISSLVRSLLRPESFPSSPGLFRVNLFLKL